MAENLMAIAYENGVNLFDTAEVYASGRSDFTFSSINWFKLLLLDFPSSGFYVFATVCWHLFCICLVQCFCFFFAVIFGLLKGITINGVFLHRAEITLGNIIKKKGWRWYYFFSPPKWITCILKAFCLLKTINGFLKVFIIPNNSLLFGSQCMFLLLLEQAPLNCLKGKSTLLDKWGALASASL